MLKRNPLLTAIIPFNDSSQLLQHSESWRTKCTTWQNKFQLILIWDRAGGDLRDRNDLIHEFEGFENLELIEGHFEGPGLARNSGIKKAKGEWIVFWDSDDEPLPVSLFSALEKIPNDEIDFLVTRYSILRESVGSDGEILSRDNDMESDAGSWLFGGLGIWRIALRRKSLSSLEFPNLSMGEDLVFFLRFLVGNPIGFFSNETTYIYRIGGFSSLTSNNKIKRRDSSRAFFLADETLFRDGYLVSSNYAVEIYVRLFLASIRHSNLLNVLKTLIRFIRRAVQHIFQGDFRLMNYLMRRISTRNRLTSFEGQTKC
jgi:teichuronic acid biosynthesis glycosyltransferase TuaG